MSLRPKCAKVQNCARVSGSCAQFGTLGPAGQIVLLQNQGVLKHLPVCTLDDLRILGPLVCVPHDARELGWHGKLRQQNHFKKEEEIPKLNPKFNPTPQSLAAPLNP